eukprot:gene12364-16586_t
MESRQKTQTVGKSIANYFIQQPQEHKNIFSWLELVVRCDLLLSQVNSDYTKKYFKLPQIRTEKLVKSLININKIVFEKVKNNLPDKFGLLFHAQNGANDDYYDVSLFASFISMDESKNNIVKQPLLSTFSVYKENYNHTALAEMIQLCLGRYNKNSTNITFMVGKNTEINQSLADSLRIPFIGCARERLNLFLKDLFNSEPFKHILINLKVLLNKLYKITNYHRFKHIFIPNYDNIIECYEAFDWVDRYLIVIKPKLDNKSTELNEYDDYLPFVPTNEENLLIENLQKLIIIVKQINKLLVSENYLNNKNENDDVK